MILKHEPDGYIGYFDGESNDKTLDSLDPVIMINLSGGNIIKAIFFNNNIIKKVSQRTDEVFFAELDTLQMRTFEMFSLEDLDVVHL